MAAKKARSRPTRPRLLPQRLSLDHDGLGQLQAVPIVTSLGGFYSAGTTTNVPVATRALVPTLYTSIVVSVLTGGIASGMAA